MKKKELMLLFSQLRESPIDSDKNNKKELMAMAEKHNVAFKTPQEFRNLITETYQEIEKRGGVEKYIHSDTSWLKSELQLLLLSYQFCSDYGLKIADISDLISSNQSNLFPKTPSQLQNTFYKLKKDEILVEEICKSKPGRKRKSKSEKTANLKALQAKKKKQSVTYSNPEILRLLSDTMNNVQSLSHNPNNKDKINDVYQLINGLHTLSEMAVDASNIQATNTNTLNDYISLKSRFLNLELEQERLRKKYYRLQLLVASYIFLEDNKLHGHLDDFIDEAREILALQGVTFENHVKIEELIEAL